MQIKGISIGFTLLTLFFLGLLLTLGFWQLDRAKQKQALVDQFRARQDEAPVPLATVSTNWQQHLYRRVTITGHLIPDQHVQLLNQVRNGRAGIHSYRPFITNSGITVLVNLGWFETLHQFDKITTEEITAEALLRTPPQVGMRIGNLDQTPFEQPIRIPYLDVEWIGQRLGQELQPYVLLLQSDEKDADEWMPIRTPPEKHQGYALTWFSLATALLILYLIVTFKKESEENTHP